MAQNRKPVDATMLVQQAYHLIDTNNTPIMHLPLEILSTITGFVDESSAAALSLTCHSMYRAIPPKNLDEENKIKLLTLLEKDVPTHFLCHGCSRLHRWHRCWFQPGYRAFLRANRLPETCCQRNFWVTFSPEYYLPFHLARIAMNAHRYGPSHGMPVEHLGQNEVLSGDPQHPLITVSYRRNVYIIRGQLLLFSVMEISHEKGDQRAIRRFLLGSQTRKDYEVCKHRELQLARLSRLWCTSGQPPPLMGSCTRCLTDYVFRYGGKAKGYSIQALVWSMFGDLSSPNDPAWESMQLRFGRPQPAEYPLGKVRDIWCDEYGVTKI